MATIDLFGLGKDEVQTSHISVVGFSRTADVDTTLYSSPVKEKYPTNPTKLKIGTVTYL